MKPRVEIVAVEASTDISTFVRAVSERCVAVFCSVMQCAAVLQCVAACCSVLWCDMKPRVEIVAVEASTDIRNFVRAVSERCVAVFRSVLQRVAVYCSALHCVAVCCSMLQCAAVFRRVLAVWFSVLQCVAVCCNVLQCVAVCRSVLQCIMV